MKSKTKNINISLTGDKDIKIEGSDASLQILLRNLIDNAINYTPEQGDVNIHISQKDDKPTIAVTDTGPGIDPEHLDRVFDRFFRILGSDAPGCGLGLSIAKHSADILKADIHLRNKQEGTGLIVEVCFPTLA